MVVGAFDVRWQVMDLEGVVGMASGRLGIVSNRKVSFQC